MHFLFAVLFGKLNQGNYWILSLFFLVIFTNQFPANAEEMTDSLETGPGRAGGCWEVHASKDFTATGDPSSKFRTNRASHCSLWCKWSEAGHCRHALTGTASTAMSPAKLPDWVRYCACRPRHCLIWLTLGPHLAVHRLPDCYFLSGFCRLEDSWVETCCPMALLKIAQVPFSARSNCFGLGLYALGVIFWPEWSREAAAL